MFEDFLETEVFVIESQFKVVCHLQFLELVEFLKIRRPHNSVLHKNKLVHSIIVNCNVRLQLWSLISVVSKLFYKQNKCHKISKT